MARGSHASIVEAVSRVELHFHLLPGVDDGPVDMETSIELARMTVADGTRVVTCTPHVRDTAIAEIGPRVQELRVALCEADVALEVRTGAELAFDDLDDLAEGDLELIAQGPPDARWLLFEVPLFHGSVDAFLAAADELRSRGYGLLIGHPERCPELEPDGPEIAALLSAGDALQVNGSSLVGRHGPVAYRRGIELVRSGAAYVIASDAHRPARGPVLGAALAELADAGVGVEHAERLVAANPRQLLDRGPRTPAHAGA
jgi:protein-tyrosine phosphatase